MKKYFIDTGSTVIKHAHKKYKNLNMKQTKKFIMSFSFVLEMTMKEILLKILWSLMRKLFNNSSKTFSYTSKNFSTV